MTFTLLGLGNPLLDISAICPESVLEKYGLKANDAILAEEKHMPLYDEMVTKYDPQYVAGGAAQNAIRGAQYLLPPKSTVYFGCVGKDKFADMIREANEREGVRSEYMVVDVPTGKCGVVVTGHNRSLCTDLAAANEYRETHMKSPDMWKLVQDAQYYYVGGYHLTVCVNAIKLLGEEAAAENKIFAMNLSAPFLATFFKDQMDSVSQYWDILIGNSDEALAYSESHDLKTTNITEIAKHVALLTKKNLARPRTVIITQGADQTIVVIANPSEKEVDTKTFPVPKMNAQEIVDSNGAGDAFAGAFMASCIQGKSLKECVDTGHWLAQWVLKATGPQ